MRIEYLQAVAEHTAQGNQAGPAAVLDKRDSLDSDASAAVGRTRRSEAQTIGEHTLEPHGGATWSFC